MDNLMTVHEHCHYQWHAKHGKKVLKA
jgi:hypothetical protein